MAAPEDRLLSTEEVAERLQVDEQTVRRWIKSGKLEAFKPGREWRITPAAVEKLLESYSSPKTPSSSPKAPEDQGGEERRGLSIQEASNLPLVVFELPGLRTARERRGVSINELSFRTGLQASEISDLESGNRVPDKNTVSLLARALDDCPHAELIFPPDRFNADTFRGNEGELTYADQLVTPGGRKLSQAINENAERRARERPEAG